MKALRSIVNELVDGVIAGRLPDFYGLRPWIERHRALPLVGDMGGFFALRADGTIVSATWGDREEISEVRTVATFNTVLCQGSRKYPDLQPLLPKRPPVAVDCKDCKGTGRLSLDRPELADVIVCRCGGLGWTIPIGGAG